MSENVVTIKGNQYKYTYQDGETKYLGPVGDSPPISEEEFLTGMSFTLLDVETDIDEAVLPYFKAVFEGKNVWAHKIDDEIFIEDLDDITRSPTTAYGEPVMITAQFESNYPKYGVLTVYLTIGGSTFYEKDEKIELVEPDLHENKIEYDMNKTSPKELTHSLVNQIKWQLKTQNRSYIPDRVDAYYDHSGNQYKIVNKKPIKTGKRWK